MALKIGENGTSDHRKWGVGTQMALIHTLETLALFDIDSSTTTEHYRSSMVVGIEYI